MGGGPSREEREAQERLRQQEAADRERSDRLLTAAEQPDPLEQRLKSENLGFLDWESGKNGPVDIQNAPGLAPYLDIYNKASQRREGERAGQGVVQLGMDQQNPELAARIREQQDVERQQAAAGDLENAYRAKSAEAHNSALPLINMANSRAMNLAGMASNTAANDQNAYLQFLTRPRQPSFLKSLALSVAGGAASNPKLAAMI